MRRALALLAVFGFLIFLPAINDSFGALTTLVATRASWMNDAMVNYSAAAIVVLPALAAYAMIRRVRPQTSQP